MKIRAIDKIIECAVQQIDTTHILNEFVIQNLKKNLFLRKYVVCLRRWTDSIILKPFEVLI